MKTTAALLFFVLCLGFLGPAIDDNSHEHAEALDLQRQQRIDFAASKVCGTNAGFEWIDETTIQCYTHKGRKTRKVEL